jgi:hypothetical protein
MDFFLGIFVQKLSSISLLPLCIIHAFSLILLDLITLTVLGERYGTLVTLSELVQDNLQACHVHTSL